MMHISCIMYNTAHHYITTHTFFSIKSDMVENQTITLNCNNLTSLIKRMYTMLH